MEFRAFCLKLLVLFGFFFLNAANGKLAGPGDGSPPRDGERDLSLVLNLRRAQGPPPPPHMWVPCVTGEKDQGGGTKVSAQYRIPNLSNEERSADTSSGHNLTSVCLHPKQAKLRQESFS